MRVTEEIRIAFHAAISATIESRVAVSCSMTPIDLDDFRPKIELKNMKASLF